MGEDDRHVGPDELADAMDPNIGDGVARNAPEFEPAEDEPSLLPTQKLLASAITGLIVYVLARFIDVEPALEQGASLLGMIAAAYIWPNLPSPGGVPFK